MAKMTMGRAVKRWWKYWAVKLHVMHDELADPKVQLEQAIQEATEQHRRLVDQAAAVIANQKQVQHRLDRTIEDYDRTNRLAHQALLLADQAAAGGDAAQAARYTETAEATATKVLTLRGQIQELEQTVLTATSQAEQAQAAVLQNANVLQQRLDEKQQLLSDLDRAKMHEAMNTSMQVLTQSAGDQVPTFVEVQRKIEARLAKAESVGQLMAAQANLSLDVRTLELEQAQRSVEAQALLAQMRAELGLRDSRALEAPRPVAESGGQVVEWPKEA